MITTDRLTLRKPQPHDWEPFRDFFVTERAQYVGGPFTVGGAWRHLSMMIGHWDMCGFGMCTVTKTGDDRAIGLVGHYQPADWPEPEIGWMVYDGYEGQGIAFEAAQAALRFAYDVLNWDTAVSYITPGNDRSVALASRLGATRDLAAEAADPRGKPCLIYRHPTQGAA